MDYIHEFPYVSVTMAMTGLYGCFVPAALPHALLQLVITC